MKPVKQRWSPSGFQADTVAVTQRFPWYWRGIAFALFATVSTALIGWLFSAGQRIAGFDRQTYERQLAEVSAALPQLTIDNAELKLNMKAFQRQAQIAKAAQVELVKTLNQLQDENDHLKEEVVFFRSIMSSGKMLEGLTVQTFVSSRVACRTNTASSFS